MTFISIILCLALERWQSPLRHFRSHTWLVKYAAFLQRHVKTAAVIGSWPGLLILLLPLIIVTGLIQGGLHHLFYGIPAWIFNTLVLLYCLGSYQLYEVFRRQWHGNQEISINDDIASEKTVTKVNLGHTLSLFNRDVFALIFWFCLFGAVGALTYRAITVWKENAIRADSELNGYFTWLTTINAYLDWIPVRLLGLSFALAGDFMPAFRAWMTGFWQKPDANENFLKTLAAAALKHVKPLNDIAAQDLAFRSLVVWVVVLAIMTITAIIT